MIRSLLFILLLIFSMRLADAQHSKRIFTSTSSPITKYLSEKKWNELFPNRYNISKYPDTSEVRKIKKDFYSFTAFVQAAKRFPKFLSEGDSNSQKRELCAFLANMAHETNGGWDEAPGGFEKWGLYFKEEQGCVKGCPQYSDTSKKRFPPVAGRSYHGRGPLQLSWNYNYAQFSEFYFGNKQTLLLHPELVTKDQVVCFASAIWFWMQAQFPKPSCHEIMTGKWIPSENDIKKGRLPGFGAVVNVINGGLECGDNHSSNTKYRYRLYQYFCSYFKVVPGANAECSTQKPFGQ